MLLGPPRRPAAAVVHKHVAPQEPHFTECAVFDLMAGGICGGGDVQDGGGWKWCGRPAFVRTRASFGERNVPQKDNTGGAYAWAALLLETRGMQFMWGVGCGVFMGGWREGGCVWGAALSQQCWMDGVDSAEG